MIIETRGDLLASRADALVNPINTRGVMGAGLALQVKRAHPALFAAYRAACARGEVRIGRVWAAPLPSVPGSPASSRPARWMVGFPTKDHWRTPSRMAYIDAGLADLVRWIRESGVRSVAVPMLGCGRGGLAWDEVRPRIEAALGGLDVRVELYVG